MATTNKTVFVTGASGFVGRNLVRRLREEGSTVRALVRKNSARDELNALGVEFVEGDLFCSDALIQGADGADAVFHLAGLTRSIRSNDFINVNRDGCRNVAAACLQAKERNGRSPILVSVSSLAAAGPAPRIPKNDDSTARSNDRSQNPRKSFFRPKIESDLPNPLSPYGKSKLAGEKELISFAAEIPISVVRPPFVFGDGDSLSLPLFRMAKKTPIFLIPGYFDQEFSFVYVSDLVEILVRVAEKGERLTPESLSPIFNANSSNRPACSGCGIYFAAHPDRPLFSQFGKMIGAAVGRPKIVPLRCPPLGVIGTGLVQECWKRLTGRPVSLDWNKTIEALSGPWICSPQKIERDLNFKSEQSLQEQIRRTAVWYAERRRL